VALQERETPTNEYIPPNHRILKKPTPFILVSNAIAYEIRQRSLECSLGVYKEFRILFPLVLFRI
jgi:hypothetical protein